MSKWRLSALWEFKIRPTMCVVRVLDSFHLGLKPQFSPRRKKLSGVSKPNTKRLALANALVLLKSTKSTGFTIYDQKIPIKLYWKIEKPFSPGSSEENKNRKNIGFRPKPGYSMTLVAKSDLALLLYPSETWCCLLSSAEMTPSGFTN